MASYDTEAAIIADFNEFINFEPENNDQNTGGLSDADFTEYLRAEIDKLDANLGPQPDNSLFIAESEVPQVTRLEAGNSLLAASAEDYGTQSVEGQVLFGQKYSDPHDLATNDHTQEYSVLPPNNSQHLATAHFNQFYNEDNQAYPVLPSTGLQHLVTEHSTQESLVAPPVGFQHLSASHSNQFRSEHSKTSSVAPLDGSRQLSAAHLNQLCNDQTQGRPVKLSGNLHLLAQLLNQRLPPQMQKRPRASSPEQPAAGANKRRKGSGPFVIDSDSEGNGASTTPTSKNATAAPARPVMNTGKINLERLKQAMSASAQNPGPRLEELSEEQHGGGFGMSRAELQSYRLEAVRSRQLANPNQAAAGVINTRPSVDVPSPVGGTNRLPSSSRSPPSVTKENKRSATAPTSSKKSAAKPNKRSFPTCTKSSAVTKSARERKKLAQSTAGIADTARLSSDTVANAYQQHGNPAMSQHFDISPVEQYLPGSSQERLSQQQTGFTTYNMDTTQHITVPNHPYQFQGLSGLDMRSSQSPPTFLGSPNAMLAEPSFTQVTQPPKSSTPPVSPMTAFQQTNSFMSRSQSEHEQHVSAQTEQHMTSPAAASHRADSSIANSGTTSPHMPQQPNIEIARANAFEQVPLPEYRIYQKIYSSLDDPITIGATQLIPRNFTSVDEANKDAAALIDATSMYPQAFDIRYISQTRARDSHDCLRYHGIFTTAANPTLHTHHEIWVSRIHVHRSAN
ncbi:hypothetical protein B0J11DRAFT_605865 [Dendryphion nanum]|uniref:Uncharacterized protein n=1 Tax=Dendryphion nanum TaxID=256645 RepID=A0A9P9IKD4_9PLEO|nr:hypothetical protein B0J11DRAFT_605865 [Dendryphion nanum]